jgi:hypothetical protein
MPCFAAMDRGRVFGLARVVLQLRVARLSAPDLLLLTGDLAYSGKAEGYAKIERLIARIEGWLGQKMPYAGLKHYEDEELVRDNLFKQAPGFLQPLFVEYEAWVERDMKPRAQRADHAIHWSARVPGDFSVVVQKGELHGPLGVVGLNSAWAQLRLCVGADQRGQGAPRVAADGGEARRRFGAGRRSQLRVAQRWQGWRVAASGPCTE